jgi:hypothetical protein
MVKTESGGSFSNAMLTGTILLANVDLSGLLNYGLKALLGGAIWLGFRYAADYLERKRREK